MGKMTRLAVAATVIATAGLAAIGCGKGDVERTVTFVYGDEVLQTVKVSDGGSAEAWRPVKDGYVFKGWYTSADCDEAYAFDGAVTTDVKIYAAFEKALEIRVKGSYVTGWEHFTAPEYTMTYDATSDRYNYEHEFVEGDEFMFYNFEKTIGDDGKEHMGLGRININSDSVDKDNSTDNLIIVPSSNIKIGKRGTYSFVYDDNKGTVAVSYSDKFESGYTAGTEWYIAGGGITQPLKSSAFGRALTDAHKLKATEGKTGEYSITLDLAKGDMFQIVASSWYGRAHKFETVVSPEADGKTYFAKRLDNIEVKESGNYTLTLVCDAESPLGDKVIWTRNGDVVQELPIVYDVFMKCDADGWKPSARYTAADGVVKLSAHFDKDDQFCFIYYDPGVDESEVGSFDNPGALITNAMKGEATDKNFNATVGAFENNFVCEVAGYYSITIDFNGGTPVVDFVGYSEAVAEYELIIKGPAYNGDSKWSASERYPSKDGKVELTLTLTCTEGKPSKNEFGFTWWGEDSGEYGEWVGTDCIGTAGDGNDFMVVDGKNNFECKRTGRYRIVISVVCGEATVDFFIVD